VLLLTAVGRVDDKKEQKTIFDVREEIGLHSHKNYEAHMTLGSRLMNRHELEMFG
jgi:hypothetical protein